MTPLSNPLLPASYDVVWSLVVIAVLAAALVGLVLLLRAARRPRRPDVVAKVESLAALRDSGAIPAEEYEDRKNRVLDRM